MIKGKESTLFVLPSEVATELDFTEDDLLKFEVKNGSVIIGKFVDEDQVFEGDHIDDK